MEDFVTFDIAKKLKEKGFPQVTFGNYNMQSACYIEDGRFYENGCITEVSRAYTAPTIAQALKWLRKEKNIDVEIHPDVGMLGHKVYTSFISTYTEFRFETSDDVVRYRQKKFNPTSRLPHEIIPAHVYFNEWEEAALHAIEYVLDNLKL